ncbi:putative ribosomal RNA-processing protein [Rosa chinensis]|uniref:Putative ribosomal RNA-processing protein n=1 Tax=Rosa chinensis TaxID=74649 RepID=A0A2P6QHV0_ROSCH|nr:putative ribosomal RNA-processing protein [Rosa chinensis]
MGKMMKNKTDRETNIDSYPILYLKSITHQHSQFMDKLVDLIPAQFYLSNDDRNKPWFQGLINLQKV